MAKRTHVVLVDDLNGKDIADGAGGPVSFGLDGTVYTIDLSTTNADKLRALLAPYVSAATKVTGRRPSSRRVDIGASAREVRDWARSNGFDLPDRGRIPDEVRRAFSAR